MYKTNNNICKLSKQKNTKKEKETREEKIETDNKRDLLDRF